MDGLVITWQFGLGPGVVVYSQCKAASALGLRGAAEKILVSDVVMPSYQ